MLLTYISFQFVFQALSVIFFKFCCVAGSIQVDLQVLSILRATQHCRYYYVHFTRNELNFQDAKWQNHD